MPLDSAPPAHTGRQPVVMLVDDDRIALAMVANLLEKRGYRVRAARSGPEALAQLMAEPAGFDAIILDREMPQLSGLDVMVKLRSDARLAAIPVILHTGSGHAEQILQGVDAGAFYYLVKPATDALLHGIVAAAVRERQQRRLLSGEIGRYGAALRQLDGCQLKLRTPPEAEAAAGLLAACFPDPARVAAGLLELLANAIEHGNLGFGFAEKTRLLQSGEWEAAVAERLGRPEQRQKFVGLAYQRRADAWAAQITDQGQGFDWRRYLHIDPARATASHGRGIARTRLLAFDRLTYNEAGNQVTAIVLADAAKPLAW